MLPVVRQDSIGELVGDPAALLIGRVGVGAGEMARDTVATKLCALFATRVKSCAWRGFGSAPSSLRQVAAMASMRPGVRSTEPVERAGAESM